MVLSIPFRQGSLPYPNRTMPSEMATMELVCMGEKLSHDVSISRVIIHASSTSLSVCLCVSICWFVSVCDLSVCLTEWVWICLSVSLSLSLSVCMCVFIYPANRLIGPCVSLWVFLCLSVVCVSVLVLPISCMCVCVWISVPVCFLSACGPICLSLHFTFCLFVSTLFYLPPTVPKPTIYWHSPLSYNKSCANKQGSSKPSCAHTPKFENSLWYLPCYLKFFHVSVEIENLELLHSNLRFQQEESRKSIIRW
jgi:hypothetical protein